MKKITKLLTVASSMLVMMLAMTFTTMAATTVTPTRAMTGSEKAVTHDTVHRCSLYKQGIRLV